MGGSKQSNQQSSTTQQSSVTNANQTYNFSTQLPSVSPSTLNAVISAATSQSNQAALNAQQQNAQLLSAITTNSEVSNAIESGFGGLNSFVSSSVGTLSPFLSVILMAGIIVLIAFIVIELIRALGGHK